MGLTERLAARSVTLELASAERMAADQSAAVLTGGLDDPDHGAMIAAAAERPTIAVAGSWIKGRYRLSEHLPAGRPGDDRRLHRLVSTVGRTLNMDAVKALVASLPLRGIRPDVGACSSGADLVADALPPGWCPAEIGSLAILHEAADATERLPAALISGPSGTAFSSLASGMELIAAGENCFAGLDLVHEVFDRADLADAFAAARRLRKNRRDDAHRALAMEALLNAVPAQADALAAALDEAVTALGHAPRRQVSIIINNYNYAPFVGDAIATALDQTVAAREVIVVDDGSTDGSRELIAATPGIVQVMKVNGGQASALNEGLKHATGEIVLFLDADDRLSPDLVERLGKASLRGVSRLQFGLETIDQAGRPTGLYAPDARDGAGFLLGALATRDFFAFMPTSGNAFPRHVLDRLPIPEPDWTLCADLYLAVACATLGETCDLGDVLGQYRVHGANGYFQVLGAEPYLRPRREEQRARAWRSLLPKLKSLLPPALAERLRLRLRHLLLEVSPESAEPRTAGRIRDLAGAVADALTCRTLLFSERLRQARGFARLATTGRPAEAPRLTAKRPLLTDLVYAAGPAKWPRLRPGERLAFGTTPKGRGIVGLGWLYSGLSGLRPKAPESFLAFRLPEIAAHWRARLDFEIAGDEPVRDVVVRLNGVAIDRLSLHGSGPMDFVLPEDLLLPWTSINAGPGARAACVSLAVPPEGTDRIRFRSIEIVLLPTVPLVAPRIPLAKEVSFSADPGLPGRPPVLSPAAGMLIDGWDWPNEQGVLMTGTRATLALSVHEAASFTLCFFLTSAVGVRLDDVLQVVVDGIMAEIHEAPDGRSFSVEVSSERIDPSRRIKVELRLGAHAASGRLPVLRLDSLRADALADDAERPVLGPNLRHEGESLAEILGSQAQGVLVDEGVALVAPGAFRLAIPVPAGFQPARLLLRLATNGMLGEPVMADVSVGGQRRRFWLGTDNLLSVDLPEGAGRPVLEGRLAGNWPFTLVSAQLFRPALSAAWLGDEGPDAVPSSFDARMLSRFVVTPADWCPVLDAALWFSAHRAALDMPPLPPDARFLDITVLTQLRPRQKLRLTYGEASAETRTAGLETLRLPVAPFGGNRASRLTVEVDAVVAATALGASGPGMLGGALCAVAVVRQRSLPALPRQGALPDTGDGQAEGVDPR